MKISYRGVAGWAGRKPGKESLVKINYRGVAGWARRKPGKESLVKISYRGVAGWVLGFALSLSLSLLVTSPARAEGIVLVAQPGEPRERVDLTPLLDTLEAYGFMVRPSQIRQAMGPRFPMAARSPDTSIDSLAKTLEQATARWLAQPPLQTLLPVLEAAVDLARRNPAYLIRRPSLRSHYHQLLIWRALAYQRAGELARSQESMSELIRTAPARIVTRAQDGPAAEQLYAATQASLSQLGRGSLEVKLDAPDVQAYLDEQLVRTTAPIPELAPGPHRLVLIDPQGRARLHEVVVVSNQTTAIEIAWGLDIAVSATARWVELSAQTQSDLVQRAELARRFARNASATRLVLIDVIVPRDGLLRVVASLRDARSARLIREASLATLGEPLLRGLGRFIGDGTPGPELIVHGILPQAPPEPRDAPPPAPRRIRKYIATAAAGTALAAGAVMLYLTPLRLCDQRERDAAGRCPTFFSMEPHGYTSLALGAALGGLAGYWWYTDRAPRPRVGVQLDPAQRRGSVVVTWSLP